MAIKLKNLIIVLGFVFTFISNAARDIPYLSSPVIDEISLLSSSEKTKLEDFIRSKVDIVQMQVWITHLENESLEELSYRAAKQWKLGSEKNDNGLLLLIAPKERRMRFEIGRGLEGDIPDILAARILDYIARPHFKKANYYLGIQNSLEEVVTLLSKGPEAAATRSRLESKSGKSKDYSFLVIFLLIFLFNAFGFGRRRSRGFVGGWGMGGSGGSWSGGGGSWGGGGGSFGGGGSSSSW